MRARTVVVVPGLASTPAEWEDVRARLPAGVAVHVVDPAAAVRLRARSDWGPAVVAARLHTELRDAARPLLLVGHSHGALHVQAFAYAHPEQCAGAVLVDGSHERAVRLAPAGVSAVARRLAELLVATGLLAAAGPWSRRLGVRAMSFRGRADSGDARLGAAYRTTAWARTTVDAWFGHGPLQAGLSGPAGWQRRGAPGVPVRLVVGAAGRRRSSAAWVATQHDLAGRLGAPAPLLLCDAGHLVALDRPDAIAAVITELLLA